MPDYPVTHVAISGDGTRLAVLGRSEQNASEEAIHFIDILDATTLQILSSVDIGVQGSTMLDISPDGRRVVYYVPYTELRAIDTVTGESTLLYPGGVMDVWALDWSSTDGRVAHAEGAAILVDDVFGHLPGAILLDEESPGLVTAIAWNPNGHNLATTTYFVPQENTSDGTSNLQIWNEEQITSEAIETDPSIRLSGGGGAFLLWSPEGDFIANSQRKSIVLFEVATGEQTLLLTPSGEGVHSIAWSPDGTQIAAGGLNVIWVWEIASRQVVNTVTVNGLVDALIWSPRLGFIHTGQGNGLYQNGNLVTAPVVTTFPEVDETDTTPNI